MTIVILVGVLTVVALTDGLMGPSFSSSSVRLHIEERIQEQKRMRPIQVPLPISALPVAEVPEAVEHSHPPPPSPPSPPPPPKVMLPEYMNIDNYLNGPPTIHFRDNLKKNKEYLTSFMGAGFTNDVMTIGNIIYLAMITSRVPILPPLTSHIEGGAPPLPFSDIFDLGYLMRATQTPILEWHQVKELDNYTVFGETDEIGCWNLWEVVSASTEPRGSRTTTVLNLDISYTRAPSWMKMSDQDWNSYASFWDLAKLAFPQTRSGTLSNPGAHPTRPSERNNVVLPPDEQLLCYDYLYYACASEASEYDWDFSPAWRFVAKHFRWTSRMENLAHEYVRRAMSLPEAVPIPPYISLHARHGDFGGMCGGSALEDCYTPLSAFARRVDEVQEELRAKHGIDVTHVIMTSDEKAEEWWSEVAERGWYRVDHGRENTMARLGTWYPVIVDAVIQSQGIGFVGTEFSTFSSFGRRRVEDWNNGVTRTVKWGWIGADESH
ncbi:hypothetical protein SCP_0115360 [Sparassis crispa]|uniref:Uncharacterized protein n=1 Tax=Sparassis crispa TaxID=139825 RepID=A0A401G906_9APHY|nr:hypothetical protein SCP_0115360 [Sparassis crispa]GBE78647.1 hypothetical protein SCP_0115360 [Sparassis crispa]